MVKETLEELCERVDSDYLPPMQPSDIIRAMHEYARWQGANAYDAILTAFEESQNGSDE